MASRSGKPLTLRCFIVLLGLMMLVQGALKADTCRGTQSGLMPTSAAAGGCTITSTDGLTTWSLSGLSISSPNSNVANSRSISFYVDVLPGAGGTDFRITAITNTIRTRYQRADQTSSLFFNYTLNVAGDFQINSARTTLHSFGKGSAVQVDSWANGLPFQGGAVASTKQWSGTEQISFANTHLPRTIIQMDFTSTALPAKLAPMTVPEPTPLPDATPEPSSVFLVAAAGLVTLAAWARKKARKTKQPDHLAGR